jgi:molybdopterin-synthase adenylyltransferase
MLVYRSNQISFLVREQLYRTDAVMVELKDFTIRIYDAFVLSANVVENLSWSEFCKFKVIDRDRIAERNLSTQPYYRSDVGAFKAKI